MIWDYWVYWKKNIYYRNPIGTKMGHQVSLDQNNHLLQKWIVYRSPLPIDPRKREYGLKFKKVTTANQESNTITEKANNTLGNIIRTFKQRRIYWEEDYPFTEIMAAADFTVRSTCNTTLQATTGNIIYGSYMLFNAKHIV